MKSLLATITLSLPAMAGNGRDPVSINLDPVSHWEVRMALYGWAQSIDGDVGAKGLSAPVDVSFDDILDDLQFAAMGAVEISYGRWSFLADLVYAETSDSNLVSSPPLTVELGYEQKQFIGNFFIIFETLESGRQQLDIYAGARINAVDLEVSLGSLSRSSDRAWIDPVVGGRYQVELAESLFFRAVGDIGGFGVSSDFTWQAMVGLGYRAIENGSILLGYRSLGIDYSAGGFLYDTVAHGPVVGFEMKF